jgi:2-isopropylmalate synthase
MNMTEKRRLKIFDTTLRDGAQTIGINLTLDDKQKIGVLLDRLGVDYIEGGWPGANMVDTEFFHQKPEYQTSTLTGFGMMTRAGQSVENDPTLNAVLNSSAQSYCLVGKSWDWHVRDGLGISESDHFATIERTISYAASRNPTLFDAEHFFDGYKANPQFAIQCLKSALNAGAEYVVLCDTNGGTLPYEVSSIIREIIENHGIDGNTLGIHTHDDTGNAVSNTIMAVQAGASLVQGTLCGIGERCGNADLVTLLPTFIHKMGLDCGAINEKSLTNLKTIADEFAQIVRRPIPKNAPYVGSSAFSTKAGLHASAQLKAPEMYEHTDPEYVGNRRNILVTNQSGFANIKAFFNDLGIEVTDKDTARKLLNVIDDRQCMGFAYDEARESLELLIRRELGARHVYFDVEKWDVHSQRRLNAKGEKITLSEATVKLKISDREYYHVAEGIGPVNALDNAFRKALSQRYPCLSQMGLIDYHVDLPKGDGATGAFTRVNVRSRDSKDNVECNTMGVSADVIESSVMALLDSYRWKIMRSKHNKEPKTLP